MLSAKEFIKEISNIRNIVIFAGAGISKDTGLPLWKQIIRYLYDSVELSEINERDLKNPDKFPEIAQKIYDYLKSNGRQEQYYNLIKSKLKPSNVACSIFELNILSMTNWILTTNFDSTIEKAFERRQLIDSGNNTGRLKINVLPDFKYNDPFLNKKNSTTKIDFLHGKAKVNHIIFRKDDYEKYYPSVRKGKTDNGCTTILEDYLKYIFRNYIVLFIGFSFMDPYFFEFLKNVYKDIENQDKISSEHIAYQKKLDKYKHFALVLKDYQIGESENIKKYQNKMKIDRIYENLDRNLSNIGIKANFCKEPIEIDNILENIMTLKKEESSLIKRLSGEDGAHEQ